MKLIGFNFNKIHAEKMKADFTNLKANTKLNIKDIVDAKSKFFNDDEQLLNLTFSFEIEYSPDVAKISFEGAMAFAVSKNDGKNILEQWTEKKIDDDLNVKIFNIILRKASVRALSLEEELNLPFHMKMPSFKKK